MAAPIGTWVHRTGPLARLAIPSSYSDGDEDAESSIPCSMDGLAEALPAAVLQSSSIITSVDAIAAETSMDINRLTIRMYLAHDALIPSWWPGEGGLPERDVDLVQLLGRDDEWGCGLEGCNAIEMYERTMLLAMWADGPFGVPRDDAGVATILAHAHGLGLQACLRADYEDDGMIAVCNAAELHHVLQQGKLLRDEPASAGPVPKDVSFGTKRCANESDDEDDDDGAGTTARPPSGITEQDVYRAEYALRCTTKAGFATVDRYTYQDAMRADSLLREFIVANQLLPHIRILERDKAAQEGLLAAEPLSSVALKISKAVDRLQAMGCIRPCEEAIAAEDVWPESASMFAYRRCGCIWPTPISRRRAEEIVQNVQRTVWLCTFSACASVLQELIGVRGVPVETIRRIARSVPTWEDGSEQNHAHDLHVQRRKHAAALGVLDDNRRTGTTHAACMPTSKYDELHVVLSFYVHLMSLDLESLRALKKK